MRYLHRTGYLTNSAAQREDLRSGRILVGYSPITAFLLFLAQTAVGADLPEQKVLELYKSITADQIAGVADPSEVGTAPRSLIESWFTQSFIEARAKIYDAQRVE